MALSGKICLVTGASRGIGKGIALQLGEAGATVYITGRSSSPDAPTVGGSLQETASEISSRGGRAVPVVCDHGNDEQVKAVFDKIKLDHGKLDILVNNAYSAVTAVTKAGQAGQKFWQHEQEPGEWWDIVNRVGLRNNYICATYAAKMMVEAKQGLIINVSSFGGQTYLFDVGYGVGKAAIDRMSADCAIELKNHNVACVTLYPGPVLTEHIDNMLKQTKGKESKTSAMFKTAESVEYSGKSVVSLASDPNIMSKTGRILLNADLGKEYGFTDIDGSRPPSIRQVNVALARAGHTWMAAIVPDFIKLPGFLLALKTSKF